MTGLLYLAVGIFFLKILPLALIYKSYKRIGFRFLKFSSPAEFLLNAMLITLFAYVFYPTYYFEHATGSISTEYEPHINILRAHFRAVANLENFVLVMLGLILSSMAFSLFRPTKSIAVLIVQFCLRLNLVNIIVMFTIKQWLIRLLPAQVVAPEIVQTIGSLGLYERSLYHPQFSAVSSLIISTPVLYIMVISSGLCYLILEVSQLRRHPNALKDLLD